MMTAFRVNTATGGIADVCLHVNLNMVLCNIQA